MSSYLHLQEDYGLYLNKQIHCYLAFVVGDGPTCSDSSLDCLQHYLMHHLATENKTKTHHNDGQLLCSDIFFFSNKSKMYKKTKQEGIKIYYISTSVILEGKHDQVLVG